MVANTTYSDLGCSLGGEEVGLLVELHGVHNVLKELHGPIQRPIRNEALKTGLTSTMISDSESTPRLLSSCAAARI